VEQQDEEDDHEEDHDQRPQEGQELSCEHATPLIGCAREAGRA
jgi:hypothetical protein